MMDGSAWVLATAGAFVGTHFILSHPLRRSLVAVLGETVFAAFYSATAALILGATVWAYRAAPVTPSAWAVGGGLWAVATVVMLAASILLLGSLVRNPALPSGDGTGARCLCHHPSPDDVVVRAVGCVPHPGLSDCEERHPVRRDYPFGAGRRRAAGSEESGP